MDIQFFGVQQLGTALWLMLLGMVGIFVVMGVILLAISLLNKYAKDKKTKNSDTNK